MCADRARLARSARCTSSATTTPRPAWRARRRARTSARAAPAAAAARPRARAGGRSPRGWRGAGPTPSSARSRSARPRAATRAPRPVPRGGQPFDQQPAGRLVQRGQRAAAGRPARGVGRVRRRGGEGVEGRDAPPRALCSRGRRPVVVEPDAGCRVERGEVAARDRRPDLVEIPGDAGQRDRGPRRVDGGGAEGPAQAPDRGAEVRAGGREVRPDAGGQRVALVRARVQGEEREQRPVWSREGHRFAVALGGDVAEQPDPQHRATIRRRRRAAYPR